jgi:hypothetical protein
LLNHGLVAEAHPARVDERVVPASYDAPLTPITPPAAAPSSMQFAPQPNVAPQPNFSPQPEPMPAAAPLPAAEPPQALSGIALLTARPADPAAAQTEHPLAPVIRWAEDALQQMQGLRDYTGTFTKREWIDGGLREQQTLFAKVRQQPFSVYVQFLAPSDVKGQEAIYVAGQNNGNMLAHPVGFKQAIVGTVSLAPDSPQALESSRRPITDFGLRRMVERFRDGAIADSRFGECDVQIIENARVGDRTCVVIQVMHPTPRKDFRFHLCRMYVDTQWNVPIRYEGYDWPKRQGEQPQLIEEYTFQGLRLNVGLSDADFNPRNPQYRFY